MFLYELCRKALSAPFDDPFIALDAAGVQKSMPYSVPSHFLPSFRHSSATAITHDEGLWHQTTDRFGVERQIKKNRSLKWGQISSAHNTALRAGAAWTPEHNHRTGLSSFPKAGVCYPTSPRWPGTADNTVVAPDPPKTPTSSAWQTPPRGYVGGWTNLVDNHGRNCVRNDSPDFSAY